MVGLKTSSSLSPGVTTQRAAVGLTVEPKVLALVQARFLCYVPYLERAQGALDGVRRGLVGYPGTLELAALVTTSCFLSVAAAE
jgi:hypothetical protein